MAQLASARPELSPNELVRQLAAAWQTVDVQERAACEAVAAADHARWEREKAAALQDGVARGEEAAAGGGGEGELDPC